MQDQGDGPLPRRDQLSHAGMGLSSTSFISHHTNGIRFSKLDRQRLTASDTTSPARDPRGGDRRLDSTTGTEAAATFQQQTDATPAVELTFASVDCLTGCLLTRHKPGEFQPPTLMYATESGLPEVLLDGLTATRRCYRIAMAERHSIGPSAQ